MAAAKAEVQEEKAARRPPPLSERSGPQAAASARRRRRQAAARSHAAVSKALTIIGMFMPKLGLTPFFVTATLTAGLMLPVLFWAPSVARSHDPFSWERATEKNRNT
jgi:hypothetical protein